MARWLVHQGSGRMCNFREVDRQTGFVLPPSVDEWLPGQHLARFVVEVVESLDLRAMTGDYRGSGSASYHPAVVLGILVMARRAGCFRAASWSGRRKIRWLCALSRQTSIAITTRSPRSDSAF